MQDKNEAKFFYDASYLNMGREAQRKYPNEELCRFIGRRFSNVSLPMRCKIKVLETGCGAGANLWMLAKEGFKTYGIDFCQGAITLAGQVLAEHDLNAELSVQDMETLTFSENYFDVVVDVFSSNCLSAIQGENYIKSVSKVLKKDGVFFSYFPNKNSDTYLYPKGDQFLDSNTLAQVNRKDSPFYGQAYPFRFMHSREYQDLLLKYSLNTEYSELITKTYNNQHENFSWCVIEAKKI